MADSCASNFGTETSTIANDCNNFQGIKKSKRDTKDNQIISICISVC